MQPEQRGAELAALIALRQEIGLKAMGCRFDRGLSNGICVTLAERGYGAWRFEDGVYKFMSGPQQATHATVKTTDDVVAETMRMAIAHFEQNPV